MSCLAFWECSVLTFGVDIPRFVIALGCSVGDRMSFTGLLDEFLVYFSYLSEISLRSLEKNT